MQLKNAFAITAASLLLMTCGQAEAQYDAYNANYDNYQETDASPFPCSWCINQGFVRGDLLYLRAFEDGLSNPFYPSFSETFISESGSDSETFTLVKGKGKEPKFRWDLGFRIGAGIDFVDCNWGIGAFWTYFHPNATKCSTERARWKLEYDTIDVLVGYKCKVNKCFIIDAFGGLRAARINQNVQGKFLSVAREHQTETTAVTSFQRINGKNKQDFDGIGFIFGLKGEFQFDCGLTFFLSGDAGTLTGCNKINYCQESLFAFTNGYALRYKRHQEACQYFVDSNIGIRWQKCLSDSLKLVLELAYETHNYFNHNRINTEGNLYINGGSFSAALVF